MTTRNSKVQVQEKKAHELPVPSPSLRPGAALMWSFVTGNHKARIILSYWHGCPPEWRTKRPPEPKPKKLKAKKPKKSAK